MHLGMQTWSRQPAKVQSEHQKKHDLSDFESGIVVSARRVGLNVSDLLGLSSHNRL